MTWHEFWESISVAQAVVWIVGGFAVVAFIVKAWPFIRNTFRILDALVQLPKVIEQVTEIHHEVHYNNGTSVKDAVQRVEVKLGKVEEGVAGLYKRADASDKADADLRHELESTHPPLRKRAPKKETP